MLNGLSLRQKSISLAPSIGHNSIHYPKQDQLPRLVQENNLQTDHQGHKRRKDDKITTKEKINFFQSNYLTCHVNLNE
ncbi:hypothetical protein BpHYR1_017488 [Brachionus plicatilis]|uniref:Uncharacterized protein n=1 Tax=Brachionus plicatilis TaxID=10195 RepID=A0A3M7QNS0_BRAPC|nr:hypothetical protein BpHYR1_017488 [Brachionus plicatilis]